ncbi:hypothetical protein MPSEU_000809900 [Mayamaea pseudoterrestris]|nr:hypothetical protein MPSEU_000809900 [Mayamaea pseudoterrestris]
MCSDLGSGSRCCAFYSATGFIFTLWVGIMIHTQPFFIAGLDDPSENRSSAFGAMFMFLITFCLSIAGIWYDGQHKAEPMMEKDVDGEYHLASENMHTYGTST